MTEPAPGLVSFSSALGINADGFEIVLRRAEADINDVALRRLVKHRADLDRLEMLLVQRLRAKGVSWHDVAAMLGITRQAAHKRFSAHTS